MKTNATAQTSKSGGVLLMAMLVMLAVTILAVGLYQMSATNAVETVYQDQSSEAFWVAETGLQDAIQRLASPDDTLLRKAAINYGSASFSFTNAADQTQYDVTVTDSGEGESSINHYEFDVVATGWKNGMNRRLQQRIATQPGYIAAIMAPNNIGIAANTLVSGPILVLDKGKLTMADTIPKGQNEPGDFDIIVLGDNASVVTKGSATEGKDFAILDLPVPSGLPDMPDFSAYQAAAASSTVTNAPPSVLDLDAADAADGTVDGKIYYNVPGGFTVNKITKTLSKPYTIVNTGNITINGSTVTDHDVCADVAILSFGSISIGQKTYFDGNNLIYGFNTAYFGDGSYCAGNSAILADGGAFGNVEADGVPDNDITMGGQSQFYGIVFADQGNVIIQAGSGGDNNTRITGTVISGNNVDMASNSEIIFDPSVFYSGHLLDLTKLWSTDVITTKKTWEELAPL